MDIQNGKVRLQSETVTLCGLNGVPHLAVDTGDPRGPLKIPAIGASIDGKPVWNLAHNCWADEVTAEMRCDAPAVEDIDMDPIDDTGIDMECIDLGAFEGVEYAAYPSADGGHTYWMREAGSDEDYEELTSDAVDLPIEIRAAAVTAGLIGGDE